MLNLNIYFFLIILEIFCNFNVASGYHSNLEVVHRELDVGSWTIQSNGAPNASIDQYWGGTASSSSGQFLVIGAWANTLLSNDFGASWTQPVGCPTSVQSVACSASGQYILAGTYYGSVYGSSDYGVTWGTNMSAHITWFNAVAMSETGQYQVAASVTNGEPKYESGIFLSSNFGSTWRLAITAPLNQTARANGLVCDSSGQIIAVVFYSFGAVYVSVDYGDTWKFVLSGFYSAIDISSSGQYMYVSADNYESCGYMSSNFGYNWTESTLCINANGVAMSGSGQITYVTPVNGTIMMTSDYGITWTATESPWLFWWCASIDSAGEHVLALSIYPSPSYIFTYAVSNIPTSMPTSGPSASPSIPPSVQPTSLPSSQPTGQPSYRPSEEPTSEPSSQPTGQPSCRPSEEPTSVPSSLPTGQPSYRPSETPPCPSGYYYQFTDDRNYVCIPCPTGEYSSVGSSECLTCPAGYSSDGSQCTICPANTYSAQANSVVCTSCAFGLANSGTGNTSSKTCVNPTMNFIIAFILLALSILGIGLYIVGGRLHRMSFVRKHRLVGKAQRIYDLASDQVNTAITLCKEISRRKDNKTKSILSKLGQLGQQLWLLIVLVILAFLVFVALFFSSILRVFFTSLILYRGYNVYINISFIGRITDYINQLADALHMKFLDQVFYPFFYVVDYIASFNINLASVSVTCLGAQAPIHLFIDCFVVGVVVIIIQSDMEVYWCTAFANLHRQYRSLMFQGQAWKDKRYKSNLRLLMWSILLQLLPHPRKLLQYGLGLVRVMLFFQDNGHAQSSSNCDATTPGPIGLDTLLALLTTIIAYLTIMPVVYILSHVIVPQFKLYPGTVKPEFSAFKLAVRSAKHILLCGKCGLGLCRQYTGQFGSLHCNSPDHEVSSTKSGLFCKRQVVYGCPAMATCCWAVCETCYVRRLDSLEDTESIDDQVSQSSKRVSLRRNSSELLSDSKRIWSDLIPYLKIAVLAISLDWFFIKSTYQFAKAMCENLVVVNEDLKKHESLTNYALDLPKPEYPSKLPWFHALRWKGMTEAEKENEIAEGNRINRKWAKVLSEFPTYYRMVLTVQDDLMPKHIHHGVACTRCKICPIIGSMSILNEQKELTLCELCALAVSNDSSVVREVKPPFSFISECIRFCIVLISWTFPGQMMSERGRVIWSRVVHNYVAFARVTVGWWTDSDVADFNLISRCREVDKYAISKLTSGSDDRKGDKNQEHTGDPSDRMNMVSSLVSSRVVLIQLVPYLTLISTLAVDIASSPCLIFSPELEKLLPALLVVDAEKKAMEMLDAMGNDFTAWKVKSLALYLIVEQSRSIQFILNVLSNLIALLLIFADEKLVEVVIGLSLLLFLATSVISLIYPFILLHKLLYPPQLERQRVESVGGVTMNALNTGPESGNSK